MLGSWMKINSLRDIFEKRDTQLKKIFRLAARTKAWVCSRSCLGIGGSVLARGMNICLL